MTPHCKQYSPTLLRQQPVGSRLDGTWTHTAWKPLRRWWTSWGKIAKLLFDRPPWWTTIREGYNVLLVQEESLGNTCSAPPELMRPRHKASYISINECPSLEDDMALQELFLVIYLFKIPATASCDSSSLKWDKGSSLASSEQATEPE